MTRKFKYHGFFIWHLDGQDSLHRCGFRPRRDPVMSEQEHHERGYKTVQAARDALHGRGLTLANGFVILNEKKVAWKPPAADSDFVDYIKSGKRNVRK